MGPTEQLVKTLRIWPTPVGAGPGTLVWSILVGFPLAAPSEPLLDMAAPDSVSNPPFFMD